MGQLPSLCVTLISQDKRLNHLEDVGLALTPRDSCDTSEDRQVLVHSEVLVDSVVLRLEADDAVQLRVVAHEVVAAEPIDDHVAAQWHLLSRNRSKQVFSAILACIEYDEPFGVLERERDTLRGVIAACVVIMEVDGADIAAMGGRFVEHVPMEVFKSLQIFDDKDVVN